jgi:L-2,4-diaminobutyrate decarboxylase
MDSPPVTTPAERLRPLFSPGEFASAIDTAADLLKAHFELVLNGQGPVQNWSHPLEKIERARQRLDEAPVATSSTIDRVRTLIDECLRSGQNLHHPHYIGHQVPGPLPLAGVFDAIGTITNQVMAVYEMGPWATAVERALIQRLGEVIGLPTGEFAGLITSGGSIANLTALLTARNVVHGDSWKGGMQSLPHPPVLLVQQDAHYCIARSAGILGMGTNQVVRVGLDDRRRLCPQVLESQLQWHQERSIPVTAVVACACATPIGAFDPLEEIADLCERFGVWLHVDAAHGTAAVFSEKYRSLVQGLGRADSLICDAHKMMHVPALCAFVFYKQATHRFAAFQQDAPYLFDPSVPGMAEYDCGLMTMECTKRAAAYGLWGVWSTYGSGVFADLVDVTFGLADEIWQSLQEQPDFEAPYRPQCNIVVFRYLASDSEATRMNDLNREIRRQLIESGEFYVSQTTLDGVGYLRMTVINPLTTLTIVAALMTRIREIAGRLNSGPST